MLDRVEGLFFELLDQKVFAERCLNGLIAIHEQVRDWAQAIVATKHLECARGASLRPIIAQYDRELAEQARGNDSADKAGRHLKAARQAYRERARINRIAGRIAERNRDYRSAIRAYREVLNQGVAFATEILEPTRRCFDASDDAVGSVDFLPAVIVEVQGPRDMSLTRGACSVAGGLTKRLRICRVICSRRPAGSGSIICSSSIGRPARQSDRPLDSLRQSPARIIDEEPTYRCGHCGFSSRYLHWQSPSCRQWNAMVSRRDIQPGK